MTPRAEDQTEHWEQAEYPLAVSTRELLEQELTKILPELSLDYVTLLALAVPRLVRCGLRSWDLHVKAHQQSGESKEVQFEHYQVSAEASRTTLEAALLLLANRGCQQGLLS